MTKRILIAGCGQLGNAVGTVLASQGHQVTGLRRSHIISDNDSFCYFQADLTKPETLRHLPSDFDLVLVIVTPSERSEAGYRAIYLQGTGHLLAHFSRSGVSPQILYISSTRVYGQHRGEWVDEHSETVPGDAYGCILLAAEQQVLGFGEQDATHNRTNTIVRFTGIYGPGAQFMQRLAAQAKPVQYEPPAFTNRVHREDCVGSLIFLVNKALSGEALASHYLVTDDEPVPKWQVVNWLAEQNGLPSPQKEVCNANAGQGKRCRNQRIREAGYNFKYPSYREGYSQQ